MPLVNDHERAIVNVHPIGAADKFVRSISRKRAIDFSREVGFVEAHHLIVRGMAQKGWLAPVIGRPQAPCRPTRGRSQRLGDL